LYEPPAPCVNISAGVGGDEVSAAAGGRGGTYRTQWISLPDAEADRMQNSVREAGRIVLGGEIEASRSVYTGMRRIDIMQTAKC